MKDYLDLSGRLRNGMLLIVSEQATRSTISEFEDIKKKLVQLIEPVEVLKGLVETKDIKKLVADCEVQIGRIYEKFGDAKALEYYEMAALSYQKLGLDSLSEQYRVLVKQSTDFGEGNVDSELETLHARLNMLDVHSLDYVDTQIKLADVYAALETVMKRNEFTKMPWHDCGN